MGDRTGSCRSREIGDTPWEGMRERETANRTRESCRSAALAGGQLYGWTGTCLGGRPSPRNWQFRQTKKQGTKSMHSTVRRGELYGGSGFREKTLRWEIATAGCRSREIGDMPWEGMSEPVNQFREAGDSVLVKTKRERKPGPCMKSRRSRALLLFQPS